MCGICGIKQLDSITKGFEEQLIVRMTDTMAYRGPNDRGVWLDGDVALGHYSLLVIDLTPNGYQPVGNEDGSVQIVYNGEVYNFRERKERFVLEK